MKHSKRTILLASLLALPLAAQAQDGFDYTYVEAALVNGDNDVGPLNIDLDGIELGASYGFGDSFYIAGSYSDLNYDFGVDGSVLTVGAGFHTRLSNELDFFADLSYVDAEVGNTDDTGYGINAGIRARVSDDFEVEGGVNYVDLDSSDTGLRIAGRYYFSDRFAVAARIVDNDGMSWGIGVRYEFGR